MTFKGLLPPSVCISTWSTEGVGVGERLELYQGIVHFILPGIASGTFLTNLIL